MQLHRRFSSLLLIHTKYNSRMFFLEKLASAIKRRHPDTPPLQLGRIELVCHYERMPIPGKGGDFQRLKSLFDSVLQGQTEGQSGSVKVERHEPRQCDAGKPLYRIALVENV